MNAIQQCQVCKRVLMVDLNKWVGANGKLLTGLQYVVCPDCSNNK